MARLLKVLVVGLVAGMVLTGGVASAARSPITIRVGMNGAQEVGTAGDPDGSGSYALTFTALNSATYRVCVSLKVHGVDAPTAAHIHSGARRTSGPVVLHLPTARQSDGSYGGCVDAPASTVQPILANPQAYYVNLHNAAYPNGAVRGQLHRTG